MTSLRRIADFVSEERIVTVERPIQDMDILRVRVERSNGEILHQDFTELQLTQSRRAPAELIAAAFPDRLDRLAIALLARSQVDAGVRGLAYTRSPLSGDPRDPPALRHDRAFGQGLIQTARAAATAAEALQGAGQAIGRAARSWRDTTDRKALSRSREHGDKPPALGPRNPSLPIYRPR